jgi:hypothetical protein
VIPLAETPEDPKIQEIMGLLEPVGDPEPAPKLTEEDRANRAAHALQKHYGEAHPPPGSQTYGEEGSDTFREAVVDLLHDLKNLLYRADYRLMLEDLAEEATDRWAAEDDEEEEDG